MESHITYARSSDGVSIAHWGLGDGRCLVQMPLVPFSHVEMEWQHPEIRRWYECLALRARIVRYDCRGAGLSQRDVTDFSLDAHIRDLDAVVTQLGPEPVTILGVFHSGPAAIAYAALHPDRVSHLILWCTYAIGNDYWRASQAEGLRALRQLDYRLFLRTGARELLGWADDNQADRFAEIMEMAVSPEEADRLIAPTRSVDVTATRPEIQCPTLVVHRRQIRWLGISLSRHLASSIPGARLVVLEGPSPLPAAGDIETAVRSIGDFLGWGPEPPPAGLPSTAFRAVLFTDLARHTEMMARLGDEGGRRVLREHERITREALRAHGGTEVKSLGDGFLASFGSVTRAVECAVALQRVVAEWNAIHAAGDGEFLSVRVGLHAGEPIQEDGDLYGTTVILASRVAEKASGGEILVANAVRELCAGKGFSFIDRGEFMPKGFEEQLRVYEVQWRS